jgi:LacI family transcriptional regulator
VRYAQIRDELHQSIASGQLKPGDRLPPEIELSQRYQTSRATVAKALGELERAGLLSRRRGAGTFVKQPQQAAAPALRIAMFTGWAIQGQPIGYFQTHVHAALSALCAEHGAEIGLQGLSAAGRDYRSQLFHAADQIIQRKTSVVCFCPAELSHEEMGVNRELVDHLRSNGCAVILIDRDIVAYPNRSDLPWVAFDNRRGAALLTRHVIDSGYKRIAFVGISRDSTAVEERLAGYADALRIAGRPVDRRLMFAVDDQPDLAFCRKMLRDAKPDAIIAKDSLFAAKIGSVLLSDGLKIGTDVGLAGFDDDPAASVLHVPLTIVRQPVEPFVHAIYQMVLRVADQRFVPGEHIVIPTELVVRASTMRGGGDSYSPASPDRATARLSRAT